MRWWECGWSLNWHHNITTQYSASELNALCPKEQRNQPSASIHVLIWDYCLSPLCHVFSTLSGVHEDLFFRKDEHGHCANGQDADQKTLTYTRAFRTCLLSQGEKKGELKMRKTGFRVWILKKERIQCPVSSWNRHTLHRMTLRNMWGSCVLSADQSNQYKCHVAT